MAGLVPAIPLRNARPCPIKRDVRSFKDTLADLPANCGKLFPGLSISEAIKANRARLDPFPVLNPRTINEGYISRLHSIFAWCVRNDCIPDNPASGIKIETVKENPEREAFKPGDLAKIFSAERFGKRPFDETQ